MDYSPLTTINKTIFILVRFLVLFVCLFATSIQAIAEQRAIIVSSNNNSHHKSLLENILLNLKTSDIKIETFNIKQAINIDTSDSLIISLGHESSIFIDQKKLSNSKLRVFTDSNPYVDLDQKSTGHLSMIQPLCQNFALARLLNSEWKVISVILSTTNTPLEQKLSACAKRYDLKLKTIILTKYINIIDALNTSLSNSDVLLALPDPAIYNAKTIKSILLTTYRHRIPVIGFSKNFVHAGALAAIHSSTKQLGKQIAELIKKHYNNENIDKHLYPIYFDVITNKNVARSLGINIPDMKLLAKKLQYKNNE